tara:strand:- start:95 stop:427 length:333 start_codon:yes stop_codon:yes gene_type:complete
MKTKRKRLIESVVNRRAKLLENHVLGLGVLPSSKLMKMKWNPITGRTLREQEVPAAAAPAAPVAPEAAPMDPLTAVLEDIAVLLEQWEDKAHPYYADVTALLMKHTGAGQ